MKRYTVLEHLDEDLAHPIEVSEKLLSLSEQTEQVLLAQRDQFVEANCPGCGGREREYAFPKRRFHYWRCADCESLYISPRPNNEQLAWFHSQSELALYKQSPDFTNRMEERVEAVTQSRADRAAIIYNTVPFPNGAPNGATVLVLGAQREAFARALRDRGISNVQSTLPEQDLAENSARLIVAYDLFESVASPKELLQKLAAALVPGGRLIMTMRAGSGFDILTLWEEAKVMPVDHLNLVSVAGISQAMEEIGLTLTELSTPGQLDVQMVEQAWRDGAASDQMLRFLSSFFRRSDDFARKQFQLFLQDSLMSSHIHLVASRQDS